MDQVIWYTTRAAGVTAYLLLFGVVALGLALSRRKGAWWHGLPVYQLHQFLTWLLAAFLGLHVLILLADGFIHFGLLDLVIPFRSAYEPLWTGVGVLAMYAVVAVTLSSAARRWLSYRVWRGIHLLSFPAFAGATVHGILAGSDGREPWLIAMYVLCGLAIAALLAVRLVERLPSDDPGLRMGIAAAAVAAICGLLFLAIVGRLASAPGQAAVVAAAPADPDAAPILSSMRERLSGRTTGDARGVEIEATLDGDLPGTLLIALQPSRGDRFRGRSDGTTPMAGDAEIRDRDGRLLFYGDALLRDGRLSLTADGQDAYDGVVLRLAGALQLPPGGGSVSATLSGGMQQLP